MLFIDGQNFLKLAAASLFPEDKSRHQFDGLALDYNRLFASALEDVKLDKQWFYSAKIRRHPDSMKKSDELVESQRKLKTYLEENGFETIIGGSVRGNYSLSPRGKRVLIFKEKGVDVRIAVDAVSLACDGELKHAVICSSDSDLQPAIDQLKKRGVSVTYIGFESFQNRGLTYTCHRTILLRDAELRKYYNGV
ncbi:MAG: NYN domain-containing protein [Fimbriimonadales bacterium]